MPGFLTVPYNFTPKDLFEFYFENIGSLVKVKTLFLKLSREFEKLEEDLRNLGITEVRTQIDELPIEVLSKSCLFMKTFKKFYSGEDEFALVINDKGVNKVVFGEERVIYLSDARKDIVEKINEELKKSKANIRI